MTANRIIRAFFAIQNIDKTNNADNYNKAAKIYIIFLRLLRVRLQNEKTTANYGRWLQFKGRPLEVNALGEKRTKKRNLGGAGNQTHYPGCLNP
jgi:hypothetical protein